MFLDNEEVIERRQLIGNLNSAQSRLRACETLLAAGTQDKVRFMEGAQWICHKLCHDAELYSDRVTSLLQEFECRKSEDGAAQWISREVSDTTNEMRRKFDGVYSCVDHELNHAVSKIAH
jgi:tRNA U54 and U55 pseudouridine synthase Pus10